VLFAEFESPSLNSQEIINLVNPEVGSAERDAPAKLVFEGPPI